MKNDKFKTILKGIIFIVLFMLIFKGTALLIQKTISVGGTEKRLIHYGILLLLLIIFIISTQRKHIIKFDIYKFLNALKIGGIPLILYSLFFIFILNYFDNNLGYNSTLYIIEYLLIYLVGAGIVEELVVRGILIDILQEYYKPDCKKNIIICCIISAVLFGLSHIINYFSKGYIPIGQMLQTIGMGLFLGSIYLRSKSLYGVALIHGLWDIFLNLNNIIFIQPKVEQTIPSMKIQVIGGIALMIPSVIIFLIILRKSKIKECYEKQST